MINQTIKDMLRARGNRLNAWICAKGYTVTGIADTLGVSRPTVTKWIKTGEISSQHQSLLLMKIKYPKDLLDIKLEV